MKITAVIPTLNPTTKIIETIDSLLDANFERILIVDDGSDESCTSLFDLVVAKPHCIVLRHPQNKGKGAALKTAMKYMMENPIDHVGMVTLDDDGQHLSKDVVNCALALEDNPNMLILGTRDFKRKDVPLKSKLGNIITASIFKYALRINVHDTQTGLRGIPLCHMRSLLKIKGDRFEYETNMLLYSKKLRIKLKEVIIDTVYIEQNANSHFHPLKDSIKIYKQIFRYLLASEFPYMLDLFIFLFALWILPFYISSLNIFLAVLLGRLCSSIFKYQCNKKSLFKSTQINEEKISRYTILCMIQAFVSACLITLLSLPIAYIALPVKLIVDYLLYPFVYRCQYYWVNQAKAQEKVKNPTVNIVKKACVSLLSIVLTIFLILVCAITLVLKGPSTQLSNVLVSTLMETSAMKFVPRLYFSEEQIGKITSGNEKEIADYLAYIEEHKVETNIGENENSEQVDVEIKEVSGSTFYGKMVILKDPSKLKVYVVDGFSESTPGKPVSEIMAETGAQIGFNGGAFVDNGGTGTGGMPLGMVIKDGKVLTNHSSIHPVLIGLDNNNQLFVGDISAQDALARGIREGVSFGPALVKNGEIVPQSGSGGGFNPRTALGQRQDGSLLVLVIDGRQPHSLGATYNDLALIMKEYGAINAGNLDGGSSSVLYQGTTRINALSSAVGERGIPSAFIYE